MNDRHRLGSSGAHRLEDAIGQVVHRQPQAVALEVGGVVLTYDELWKQAGDWADCLRPFLNTSRRVALVSQRDALAYSAYLGILRAGGTVVPVNAEPHSRLRATLEAADPSVAIVIDNQEAVRHVESMGIPCVVAPRGRPDPLEPPAVDTATTDVAYILFTSGSTGAPKGVPISHANVLSFIAEAIACYGLGEGCRMSQNFDLTFDVSVFDLIGAWASGATLVVPTKLEQLHPVEWVQRSRITHWASVPSVITAARGLKELHPGTMPGLVHSLFIGEPLRFDMAAAWAKAANRSSVHNFYGPTELTIAVSSYALPRSVEGWPQTDNGTIPIGELYPQLEWFLRSTDGSDGGARGELCVRGPQRFAGYVRPEDNVGRFLREDLSLHDGSPPLTARDWYRTGDLVADLGAGQLVHLGRIDNQVQIRGYRVEPGDIESALTNIDGVDDAAVVAVAGASGQLDLVAFVLGWSGTDRELRAHLAAKVPLYMLPRRFVRASSLPLTASGKTDRLALKLAAASHERTPPHV